MKRKALLLSLVGMVFFSANVNSQIKWSLDSCISYAMEHNLQIKRQELSSKIAKTELLQSKIELLPDLSGYFNHSYEYGNKLDISSYSYVDDGERTESGNLGAQSNIVLFNGFQLINTIRQNKSNMLIDAENLNKLKNDINIQIATAYLQILFDKELLDIAEKQLIITELQVDKTSKLVEVGNIAKGELLEIKSQLAAEKVNVTNAKNDLNLAYLTLIQLLDLDSDHDFEIIIPENLNISSENILNPLMSIYNTAESFLPQIKSAEYGVQSAKRGLLIAYGDLFPQVTLSYSRSSWYSENSDHPYNVANPGSDPIAYPFSDQIDDHLSTTIRLSVSIPIFNKLRAQKNISNSKVNVLDAQYQLDQTKQVLYKEIQQAYADAIAAFENYNSRQEAVVAMEEAFNYTQQRFDVGIVNSVDYNIAKNNLTKAQSDLLQAKYQYIFKTKVLDFYQGRPITL